MGHYDSCYEADAQKDYETRKDDAGSKIRNQMYEMNADELEMLAEIAENIHAFITVFQVINKLKK